MEGNLRRGRERGEGRTRELKKLFINITLPCTLLKNNKPVQINLRKTKDKSVASKTRREEKVKWRSQSPTMVNL
jgi:post-segregation antitoxin (ccd killing protein)